MPKFELYNQLSNASSNGERRAITDRLIDKMRLYPERGTANAEFYNLCNVVMGGLGHAALSTRMLQSGRAGEFPPFASAALVLLRQRVSGFLGAIHNLGKLDSAIEAGPGASAILSIGAAKAGAHVTAYEINIEAAHCAQEVVNLTGYAEQIKIITGDVLRADLPRVDVAIAEILGPGLRGENGPAIIAHLKKYATHVIPDGARLYAADTSAGDWGQRPFWQRVAEVDLTNPAARVSGRFESADSGVREVMVRADIFSQGRSILVGSDTDDITSPVIIGGPVGVPYPGATIEFAYNIGPVDPGTDYLNVQA